MDILLKDNINLLDKFNYPLVLVNDNILYNDLNKLKDPSKNDKSDNIIKVNEKIHKKIVKDNIIFSIKKHPLLYKFLIFIINNYNKNNSIEVNFGFKVLSYFIKKNGNKYNIKFINYNDLVNNNLLKYMLTKKN